MAPVIELPVLIEMVEPEMSNDDDLSKLPLPLTQPDCDLRGLPVPREMLVRCAMFTWNMTEREADLLVQKFFSELPQ